MLLVFTAFPFHCFAEIDDSRAQPPLLHSPASMTQRTATHVLFFSRRRPKPWCRRARASIGTDDFILALEVYKLARPKEAWVYVTKEAMNTGSRTQSSHGNSRVLIHLSHQGSLVSPVCGVVLNDTKSIDPDVRKIEPQSNIYTMLPRLGS